MSRSTKWCFTLNNYEPHEVESLRAIAQTLKVKYLIFGYEKGESGTPHLQGYIVLMKVQRLAFVKKILSRAHWAVARGNHDQNIKYCSKEGAPEEYGDRPMTRAENMDLVRADYGWAIGKAKEDALEEIEEKYPDLFLRFRTALVKIRDENLPRPKTLDGEFKHEWIWGPAGVGKSRTARQENPDFYDKLVNKWWCGYHGEPVVIIDDLHPVSASFLKVHLKRWSDRYSFPAEVKGSSMVIRPEKIVVTSQYSIAQTFPDCVETREALERRFIQRHMGEEAFPRTIE